jgi:acetyl esterase/lipase
MLISYYYINSHRIAKNISYKKNPGQRQFLDVYYHKSNNGRDSHIKRGIPVIIFVHGGAWGFNRYIIID